jgi:hypothetical protein
VAGKKRQESCGEHADEDWGRAETAARSDFKIMLHKGNSKWRISVDERARH